MDRREIFSSRDVNGKLALRARAGLFMALLLLLLPLASASLGAANAKAANAEAANAVRGEAFLSRLLAARGFETKPSARENAAFILKSGIVTDAVDKLAEPAARRNALRWAVQSLGLSSEARILSGFSPSVLALPFKDAKSLSDFERGCLAVAAHMRPPLLKGMADTVKFGAAITPKEADALIAAVKEASRSLKLELSLSPAAGMTLEIRREGAFSGIPKWRVHIDGFDTREEVLETQRRLASQGFATEPGNPNYEWRLSSPLLEDYASVRRLAALAKTLGRSSRIFPSLTNELENQPVYWALLTLDPSRYRLEPILAPDGVRALAPLSAMAKKSEARAAVNAGFFSVTGRNAGLPIGTLRVGRLLVSKPYPGRTCLGWSADNRAAFGEVSWSGRVRVDDGWLDIHSLNHPVKGNALVLYNPFYGKATPARGDAVEAVVRAGRCVSVRFGGGTEIEPGTYVLAGYQTNAAVLERVLRPGARVEIESVFNEGDPLWNGLDDIIQAGPFLIHGGEVRIEPEGFNASLINLRHPRSVMGLTERGQWVFFVGDGRDGMHSAGFTLREAADLLRKKGVAYALNLDGGGSTELLVNGALANVPSEKRERPISYGIGAKAR
ncbi:MAG: phosphodiester glycosidase family protein [Synergistaceae bacterium]|nr:phosphodiester glycosidase family protein [Synergistaceae bacterium]